MALTMIVCFAACGKKTETNEPLAVQSVNKKETVIKAPETAAGESSTETTTIADVVKEKETASTTTKNESTVASKKEQPAVTTTKAKITTTEPTTAAQYWTREKVDYVVEKLRLYCKSKGFGDGNNKNIKKETAGYSQPGSTEIENNIDSLYDMGKWDIDRTYNDCIENFGCVPATNDEKSVFNIYSEKYISYDGKTICWKIYVLY